MRVDGRRLVRAGGVALALFLLVGGGVGFVMAAGEQEDLAVPMPRPGDRVVYTAQRIGLDPDLALGGANDIRFGQAVYEWLPEQWVVDATFGHRLARPLHASYTYGLDARPTTYERIVFYDAALGHVLFHQYDTYSYGTIGGPTIMGDPLPIVGDVDFATEFERFYFEDEYHVTRTPCGTGAVPLHGTVYDGEDVVLQGRCGWQDREDQILFNGDGWHSAAGGRAYRFTAEQDGRLQMWFRNGVPFPVQLTTSSAEITDPAWAIGRLFRLTMDSYTPGTDAYTEVDPADLGPALGPVPSAPRTAWMLDDQGMEAWLPLTLQQAYATALAQAGPQDPEAQPHAADWLRQHPDGYLAAAWALEYHDQRSGETVPQWILLWVDGASWLGKRVTWEAAAQQLALPAVLGRHGAVTDWTPSWLPEDVDAFFPDVHQLPAAFPRPVDMVEPYLRMFGPDAKLNRYGFQVYCGDAACVEPKLLVEVGRHEEPSDPGTQRDLTEQRNAFVDKLLVGADGEAESRVRITQNTEAILPVDEMPPPQAAAPAGASGAGRAWGAPVTPQAAASVGLVALLGAALYYFWPALKGAFGQAGLGLFSRIQDDAVLEHPVRRAIADALDAEPGIHFLALSRKVGAGRSALDHHLRKMEAAGLVTKARSAGFTCYFPKGRVDRHAMAAAPALRTDGSRAILQAIAAHPGANGRDLATALGLSPSTVSYHLKRLEQAGLVSAGRGGVHLTPLGSQATGTGAVAA